MSPTSPTSAAPWVIVVAVVVTGLLVAGLSLRRRPISETYGDWHRLTN